MSVPADGARRRRVHLSGGFKFHPDGNRIAYMTGDSRGEVWVMDGIVNVAAAAADAVRPR